MVFAVVLTMPFLSLISGAMTEKTLYADMPVEWAVSYDPRTDASDLVPESDNKALPFFSDGADTPYTFYTFLNSNQRAVYNTVKEKLFESSIDVALPSPLTWDGTSTSVPSNIKSALSEAVTGGLSALCDDYPMIFWINGYSISYGYSYYQTSSGYHFTISSVTVKPRINTNAYADMNKVKQDYNDMAAVVDSVEIKGATRYEKVKFIHDFICKRVEYDEKFEIPTAHEPTSVFLTPYKTVCEGYSESFKILCDKAGIPWDGLWICAALCRTRCHARRRYGNSLSGGARIQCAGDRTVRKMRLYHKQQTETVLSGSHRGRGADGKEPGNACAYWTNAMI